MLPETLVALACVIANTGPMDASKAPAQLTNAEKDQVQSIIDSGVCLPEDLEKLLKDTQNQIENGFIQEMSGESQPTRGCG